MSNSAQALPLVVLQDSYTNTIPSAPGAGVIPPNTFTSVADVGGTITYTVNTGEISVGFLPAINLFGGSTTSGSFFTVLNTIAGNPYEVDFTTLQGGNPSSHALKVNAFNGNGVGGTLLGNSGPVGINSSGNFKFTATSGQSTLEVLGILGTPNISSDIAFDNLKVSTVAVPVPESEPLAMLGLVTVIGFGTGLQRKLAKNSQKK
ncbi:MAG: PEP-CTERM sorting domain-containing protein [Microcystis aeruginosa]